MKTNPAFFQQENEVTIPLLGVETGSSYVVGIRNLFLDGTSVWDAELSQCTVDVTSPSQQEEMGWQGSAYFACFLLPSVV